MRGNEIYNRPRGWKRIALKVNGKYVDDDWLGSSNSEGEWPVFIIFEVKNVFKTKKLKIFKLYRSLITVQTLMG